MLKGKTELILTDVRTGSQEKVLEHNMVTNALSDIFRQEGYMKDCGVMYSSIGQPLYTSLLGGILLFDTALEEDASKYYAPPGVRLTASGVYGIKNTVSSLLRGDYNSEESKLDLDAKTMKYVYDFPTSKGNGKIASVCLTSKWAGFDGYGAAENNYTTNGDQSGWLLYSLGGTRFMAHDGEYTIAIDEKSDVMYSVAFEKNPESTSYDYKIIVYKRWANLKNITILRNIYSYHPLIEKVELSTDNFYSYYSSINYDRISNAIYVVTNGTSYSAIDSGKSIIIYCIPLDTLKLTKILVTNTTGTSIAPASCYVYNGFLYCFKDSAVYKIRLSASGDVTRMSTPSNFQPGYTKCIFERNGLIYAPYTFGGSNDYKNYAVIDTEKNIVLSTNCRSGTYTYTGEWWIAPIIGNDIMLFKNVYRNSSPETGTFQMQTNYLATINNLSTPITKTAAQTMKVIYTISEGEPDADTV